ncbi:MAG: ATP-binding protein [Chloroflexi bacterium]|nr:ATP-binding protein [Chloroflexota bacterium]
MVTLLQKARTSRVNARRLLEDLAAGYSHGVDEAVLMEAVANALDAKASRISFVVDGARRTLRIEDDGEGMSEGEFERYHDLAESSKTRGSGIGFAGLGAKLAHQITTKIITESRQAGHHAASEWQWHGEDLQWKFLRRRTLHADGTCVTLHVNRKGISLLDESFIKALLAARFSPLLDEELCQFYIRSATYPQGITFSVNGTPVQRRRLVDERQAYDVTYCDILDRRKLVGRGLFALMKSQLPEQERGVALCTYGKVIRRDTLGLAPLAPDHVTGWVEVPGLVECLTTNKQDFLLSGALGQKYYRLRTAVQKAYGKWLAQVGQNVSRQEAERTPTTLQKEVRDIVRNVPELRYLFGARIREAVGIPAADGEQQGKREGGSEPAGGDGTGGGSGTVPGAPGSDHGDNLELNADGDVRARPRRRRSRLGPMIRFVSDQRPRMSWLEGDVVYVNASHPSYIRAQREHQIRYHRRLVVLLALCEEAPIEPAERIRVLDKALARWGAIES